MTGKVYHVFTKSIAGYKIFNNDNEFLRMIEAINHYRAIEQPRKLSKARRIKGIDFSRRKKGRRSEGDKKHVKIIAYCLMPTHIHLVLKQLEKDGISIFMNKILNSYSRYFNIKHGRKGPLWEGRFKKVLVENDEQLLHLTRYVHLNPVTSALIKKPEQWTASSYKEYIETGRDGANICSFAEYLDLTPKAYQKFTEDRIAYQRQLKQIKDLLLD